MEQIIEPYDQIWSSESKTFTSHSLVAKVTSFDLVIFIINQIMVQW